MTADAAPSPSAGLPCVRCGQPAQLQCPRCLELKLEKELAAYCSQSCFKEAWASHKLQHKPSAAGWHYVTRRGTGRSLTQPEFAWTGSLRPERVGPTQAVPAGIPLPDYAADGYAREEVESKQQRTVVAWSGAELDGIRAACSLGRDILDLAHAAIRPGVTTDEIDALVHDATVAAGAYPAPLNYFNFPKSTCTSVNEVICHGIPDRRPLADGDIVNVDVSVKLNGWHSDLNETFVVGNADAESKRLIKTTHDCLTAALKICKPGARYRDLGDAIARVATAAGYGVVKSYSGHGVGSLFHCAPNIPHYSHNKAKGVMLAGQVFTVEPMINAGSHRDRTWPDGWTAVTEDGSRSAQFEHQILITDTGCEVLTARKPTSPPLWWEVPGAADDKAQA